MLILKIKTKKSIKAILTLTCVSNFVNSKFSKTLTNISKRTIELRHLCQIDKH